MKKFNLFVRMALFAAAGLAAAGCSSDVEPGFHPGSGTRVEIAVRQDGAALSNHLLNVGSGLSRTSLQVDANTRWTVEISDCPGSWCTASFSTEDGIITGDGSFVLETSANRSESEKRTCTVTVYGLDMDDERVPGVSYAFTVTQENRRILVSNPTPAPWPALGGEDSFSITSNLPWSVTLSDPTAEGGWMDILPAPGMERADDGSWHYTPASTGADGERVTFSVRMAMNPSASARLGQMTISSPDGSFLPVDVPLEQRGLTETFAVTPVNLGFIEAGGETLSFSVYSPAHSWSAALSEGADWLTVTPGSGEATAEGMATVIVKASANPAPRLREAVLTFRSGDEEVRVYLTQMYDAQLPDIPEEPVISRPWISEGWTPDYAVLNACYLAPRYGVTECGARLRPAGGEWRTVPGQFVGDDRMVVELEGLTPGTRYEAAPYVIYASPSGDAEQTGETVTFTTPEYMPGSGDNPPPVVAGK